MEKEPWVFKKNYFTLEGLEKGLEEAKPKMKDNWDKLMNEEMNDAYKKVFKLSR